jgi:hypothetical protein
MGIKKNGNPVFAIGFDFNKRQLFLEINGL